MRPLYPRPVCSRSLLAPTIAFALSSAAIAQEVAPDTENEHNYIEEITVTAQMREQSVMDVPVTMDVIGSEFLERTNIMELDELSRILPNVQIQEQAVSLPSFNIRGVTDDVSSVSATPRISVYQDGFDISKKTVASVALFDIARVEVLKGPQPTLFGVAAANGAVSIHSNLPTFEQEGKVQVGYNSEQGQELEFMYNQPINDNHSFRIAGLYREMDGIVENNACSVDSYYGNANMYNHLGEEVPCNSEDLQGVSVQALRATWRANYDQLEIIARAAMEYNDQPGIAFKSGSIAPNGGDTSPFTDAEFSLGSELGIERTLQAYDLTVNYDFNQMLSLHADAYYKDVEVSEGFDADGSALRIQDAYFDNDATLKGASMRLVYDSGDKLAAFVGASITQDDSILPYYVMVDPFVRGTFDAVKAQLEATSNIPLNQNIATGASLEEIEALRAMLVSQLFNEDGSPISNPALPPIMIRGPFIFEAELDIASYVAEVSYFVTDDINITAGVRYIDETRYTRNTYTTADGAFTFDAERDFDDTLPRFAISYDVNNNWNVYANYARGRRSPVVDANAGGVNVTKPEIVDSYDLGIKYQSANFLFSGAIFTYEYSDYQQSFTDAKTLQSITVTVGDSTMSGIEGMATYNYSETLTLTASLGFLDAEFADNTADGSEFQYGGNKFRLAPEVSGAININKVFNMDSFDIDVNWLTSFQSEVFFESSNYPGLSQDTYSLTDVSVKLLQDNSKFAYELYVNNLFDKEFLIDAGNTGGGLGIPTFVRGMPRIAGVRVYYEF
ncbi:TonB-dependent receptor [Alteromonas sp. Cnat3-28]|uniref:TonB-dependent receptor n=1 Tax=Alteromonas sp. Cnat3-28 TaxID=2917729 RepID=UPI001EF4FBF0|nr:TonB-dependent receptor [Alteromonas sp. Cnat3-28]MCG7645860.1 TonB-dependent receptor [Alteromonas sp. Cnat3-28]